MDGENITGNEILLWKFTYMCVVTKAACTVVQLQSDQLRLGTQILPTILWHRSICFLFRDEANTVRGLHFAFEAVCIWGVVLPRVGWVEDRERVRRCAMIHTRISSTGVICVEPRLCRVRPISPRVSKDVWLLQPVRVAFEWLALLLRIPLSPIQILAWR
jgi:hypothetical protein